MLLLAGCSEPKPSPPPDIFLGAQAETALRAVGIDRRAVHAIQIPMALNRLVVELESLNPWVPNLSITLVETATSWELQSPQMEEVARWLAQSDGG